MKVLQITGEWKHEFIEMPVPQPEAFEVLVKRLGIVTCNAYDLHVYNGEPFPDIHAPVIWPITPGRPGHEWVGEIVATGEGVSQLRVGDWVCMPGGRGVAGQGRRTFPGGYAPYSVCAESALIKVPAGMDVAKLAPVEMATCVAANILDLKQMNAVEGKIAAVLGLGPAGLIAAEMLRSEGAAEIVGVEVNQSRREYALSQGIVDRVIDPTSNEGKSLPLRRTGNSVFDIAIDCAAAVPGVQYLMDHTENVVSLFATQNKPYEFRAFGVGPHMGLKLHGHPGRNFECGEYAVRRVKNGLIDLSKTISHTMRLEEYGKALEMIRDKQCLKVLFTFDERDW